MMRLLLARLVGYRSLPKFLALHGGGTVLVAYVASRFTSVEVQGTAQPLNKFFDGLIAWHTVAWMTRWLFVVPAFFSVQLAAAELELRLVRAQVVAGLEHHDVVLGWTLQSALLSAFGVAVGTLMAAALGGSGASAMLVTALGLFAYGLIFLCIAVCITAFLRRPVPALVLLLLWPIAIEPLVSYFMGRYGLSAVRDYLPFAALSQLVPWPDGGLPINPTVSSVTLAALGYGVLATCLTWLKLRRADL